jgi:hypothetical protein
MTFVLNETDAEDCFTSLSGLAFDAADPRRCSGSVFRLSWLLGVLAGEPRAEALKLAPVTSRLQRFGEAFDLPV